MFAPAYMGRKRCLRMLSPSCGLLSRKHYLADLAKSVRRGFAPSFSSHVRWGERGAPFQRVELASFVISRRYSTWFRALEPSYPLINSPAR
jgi:hypothetical protein